MFSLDWPRVNGKPLSTAVFKLNADDFHVNEFFSTEFSGQGEHILLKIEKKGLTTEELIKSLSRAIHTGLKFISYAGLKDRQSLATQWISIHAPGKTIEGIDKLEGPGWRVIESTRHHKKLRAGFLTGNQFKIKLRDVSNLQDLIQRIARIKESGVPNYFGEQRFGRVMGNLIKAEQMLVNGLRVTDRFLKGMYFSAARSWIFNQILARRVQEGSWNTALNGDVMQLGGTNSIFTLAAVDAEITSRIKHKDVSPASPMPGKGKMLASSEALGLINEIYAKWVPWINGLEQQGLETSWRANILHVEKLEYSCQNQEVELSFILPAGAYATVVLRELVSYST